MESPVQNMVTYDLGPSNEMIIVDNSNRYVIVSDCKLNLLRVIGKGFGLGTLTDPCCVAVSNEVIAISDQQWSHQVKKYTLQGEFISAIGHYGTKIGEFDYPRGLVFNNSNLYVVDGYNYRVTEMTNLPSHLESLHVQLELLIILDMMF